MTYTDPVTGWTATYLCAVCFEPYPVQVQRKPRLPCSQCESRQFRRARKSSNQENACPIL